ncbi:TonB-dependent receptor plug domain-containing protein [Sphingomonas baiyangensis]|nr:TonB-dependent receptor [Sphingomonas baiyangensis]
MAALLGATPLHAQEVPTAADPEPEQAEEITVTGSRLVRRDLVATSPITTVGEELISDSGNVTLESTLNNFPQLTPDNTSTTNQSGGAGVLSVDLRSLGAVRTLVLVDGKRFIPGDVTGLVDLAAIPDRLIDRVEVITGGASAVYGSDAVAGAVNFVLKRDFEGVEASYQYGETTRRDGISHKADLVLGVNAPDGRGNVTAYASYTRRGAIFMGDRAFSANPLLADAQGVFQPFGSGNIPGGLIGINTTQIPQLNGIPDLNNASGACPVANTGIRFGQNGEPLPYCRPRDQFNYAAPNFLLRPLERYQAAVNAHYDIASNVEVYGQFFFTRKENSFQQAAEAVTPSSSGQSPGTVLIPNADTNPLFTDQQRAFFAANRGFFDPDGDGVFTLRNVGRRFEEFGPRNVSYTADSFGLTGGLRGNFNVGERRWNWDAFYQYHQSDVTALRQNLLSRSRTTAGLDVVLVGGVPQCRNREVSGCIPVNIFGTGTLTQAQADFLSVDTTTRDRFDRTVLGGALSGELFDLWAGPVALALGAEYRKDRFSTNPDEVALSNDLAAIAVPPVVNSGEFSVREIFGEIRVPLLRDVPLIRELAVEGAIRYADYSTIGGVTTWKGAVDWQVTDWARLRGNYSRAIRAPNLNELFAPVSSGFIGGNDPCVAANRPSAAQKQLCLAQGVPQQFIDTLEVGGSQGFDRLSGGNANLTEESADTFTVGAVLTPFRGFALTIDYFDIKVDDAIAQVDAQQLINTCFQTLDAASLACTSITRNDSGNIERVSAPLLNIASRRVRGLDATIDYRVDLDRFGIGGDPGTLAFQIVGTWQFEDSNVPLEGLPAVECAGFYGGPCSSDSVRITPDFRAFASATYSSGPLTVRNQLRYIDDVELSPLSPPNQAGTVAAETYWDLFLGFQLREEIELFGGMNNILDNQPPILGFAAGGDANTNVQLYDVIGRQFYLGARLRF